MSINLFIKIELKKVNKKLIIRVNNSLIIKIFAKIIVSRLIVNSIFDFNF